MRAAAPAGTEAHRSYKSGRLLVPGFLKRSIRVITKVDKLAGSVSAIIGVRKEAFYGPQFYDQGPITIRQRRVASGGMSVRKAHVRVTAGKARNVKRHFVGQRGLVAKPIKPYTLRRVPFFQSVFVANRAAMEGNLVEILRSEIEKAAK